MEMMISSPYGNAFQTGTPVHQSISPQIISPLQLTKFSSPNNDWERFQQNLERARRKLNKSLGLPATKEVGTIATLLLQLRQITEERLGSPITSAVISRPMLPGLTAQDLDDAMEYAGMKILSSYNCLGTYITSTSVAYAATNHGLCSNPADIESCEDEEVNMPYKFVLSVSFTNTALSFAFTTFRAAHLGYENIYRPYIYMGLDAQERYSGNKTRYWEAVGQRIRNFNSYLQRIDMVLVMGEAAGNEEFKRVLREALRDYRPPLGTEPVMIEDDYAMVDFELADVDEKGPEVLLALNASDKFDPLGLAARGAAEFAKRFQVMTWDCTEPAKCYRDEGAAQRLNSDL